MLSESDLSYLMFAGSLKPVHRTTGVTAAVVERMEVAMKQDALKELRHSEGRLLLHDEVETKPGCYEIIPIWETCQESDIMTPRELYESVISEGYKVDYMRVAIVSYSISGVHSQAEVCLCRPTSKHHFPSHSRWLWTE